MRTVNIVFEDKEFEQLLKHKGKMSWRDFVLNLIYDKDGKDRI